MKCPFLLAVCLLLAVGPGSAWGQRSSYDPAAKQQSKPREGFVDFALKQINPQNIDYGCQLDETRKLAVDQTIKSIDSWAVMIALGFLVLSFFLLLHQHRERNRREAIAAELLAQYHNAWMDARTQAADAIRRYNELVHATNSAGETMLKPPSIETGASQTKLEKRELARGVKQQTATVPAARSEIKAGENGAARTDGVRQNREPDVDLMAQISTLQQQLNASHEREKNLQKELGKAQRRAPAVQPQDTTLPG
jgi:hypothetical protein